MHGQNHIKFVYIISFPSEYLGSWMIKDISYTKVNVIHRRQALYV